MHSILYKAVQIILYMCQMLDCILKTDIACEIMVEYF